MTEQTLFTPTKLGEIAIANRVVMAPLTRNRAEHGTDVPSPLAVDYYAQRASAGLLITEASQISPEGKGYKDTPGIYSPEQIAGWRKITDAVHAKGGKIVIQLWHVGRISHTSLQPNGQLPVAPSALNAGGKTFNDEGFVDTSTPRALELDEMPRIVADFVAATRNARAAGFDGVEVHGANGYLLDTFLKDGGNQRNDAYGGSIENRARLMLEVMEATSKEWPGHVGLRLSPFSNANEITESDPMPLYEYLIPKLNAFNLAYLHMIEGQTGGPRDLAEGHSIDALRALFDGAYMANNGYSRDMALDATHTGRADAIAFGRSFISNPDLVARLKQDAPLNKANSATFYGGGAEGYTDYPTLGAA